MAEEVERLVATFEARFSSMDKALAKMLGDSRKAFGGIEAAGTKAETTLSRIGSRGTPGLDKLNRSLGQTKVQVGNVAAQFSDIGVQLAGGQSPFLIALQQGNQLTAALGSGGLGSALRGLGAGFLSLINPLSLATIATIGLGGVAIQYFTSWLSEGKATSEEIQKQSALIERVADKYGDLIPAVRDYADQLKRVREEQEKIAALKLVRGGIAEELKEEFRKLTEAQVQAISMVVDAQREYTVLAGKMESGSATAADFQRVIDALNITLQTHESQALRGAVAALTDMQKQSEATGAELKKLDDTINAIKLSGDQAKDMAAALTTALAGLGTEGGSAVRDIASAFLSSLTPAMVAAGEAIERLRQGYDGLSEAFRQSPLGQLEPLVSGGGQFLNPEQAQQFRADRTLSQAHQADPRSFLRSRAVSDRIAERIDLLNDALAGPLARLLAEFPDMKVISAFRTKAEQAAIYNRPGRTGMAAPPGHSRHERGAAVDLQGPNLTDAAFLRRARELGLTSIPGDTPHFQLIGDRGGGGGTARMPRTPKKTPSQLFEGDIAQVQARIDLINAEIAAQTQLNPLIDDYGLAVEKARIQQQLLSEAKKAGLTITPELSNKIAQLAENYAKASAGAQQLQASQEQVAQSAQAFRDLGRDVLGGFISDLRAGKSASEALLGALDRIADRLLDMVLDSFFAAPGKGGGGLFGGALIPGILHGGGVAGRDGYGHGRSVSPRTFVGARRMHGGGIAGVRPGEVPTLLKRGEIVSPVGAKRGGAGGGMHITLGVSVDKNGNLLPFVQSVSQQTSAQTVQAGLRTYDANLNRTMGQRISVAQRDQL